MSRAQLMAALDTRGALPGAELALQALAKANSHDEAAMRWLSLAAFGSQRGDTKLYIEALKLARQGDIEPLQRIAHFWLQTADQLILEQGRFDAMCDQVEQRRLRLDRIDELTRGMPIEAVERILKAAETHP